jgi:hypothetical protein
VRITGDEVPPCRYPLDSCELVRSCVRVCVCASCAAVVHLLYAAPDTLVRFVTAAPQSIDGVGPGKVAYQVTTAQSYSVETRALRDAVQSVQATADEPLRFCFVVGDELMSSWAVSRPIPVADDIADKVKFYVVNVNPAS